MKNTQNIEKSRKHFGENFMLLYLLVDTNALLLF